MDEKQLKALIKKTVAKVERTKPKKRPTYDAALDATQKPDEAEGATPGDADALGDAEQIFKEMKRREF